jgi:hydrogenase maturation protease
MSASGPARVCVVGIGNVLLGDDGFGPLVVEMFRSTYECDSKVEIRDLGTPGLDIAPYLYDADLVVLVDAVHAAADPGTLCIYCEDDLLSRRTQLRLTAHDPGVQQSLAQLRLAGHSPSELVIVGVVPESCGLGEGVSECVVKTCLDAVNRIARLLTERSIGCRRRDSPSPPNLWWLTGNCLAARPSHRGSVEHPVSADA